MSRRIPGFVLSLLLLSIFACQGTSPIIPASRPDPISTDFPVAKLGTVERNITYCTMDGVELKLDAYYPASANGRWPALVYIHGGSWTGGDKRSPATQGDRVALVEAGFLVVSINYRLAPEYRFPAMIEDAKCAVRYLRAHADEYNLDPERMGAFGNSAGGHIAALLGLANQSAGWDVGPYREYPSAVGAVVDLFGPADLTVLLENNSERVFRNEDLAVASPVNHVTEHAPPFLILHGDNDSLVPLEQSQALYERLTEHGIRAELVIVRGGGHGFTPADSPDMQPSREEVTHLIVEFFQRVLKVAN
jgi:acetyl esterase/lipase